MGSWDRYGESKKYNEQADTNTNPKHVGESLRQLTLEDRLELRRQQRELQKKRKSAPTKSAVELLLEDDELSADTQRPSKVGRPNSRPKDNARCSVDVLGEEDSASQKRDCDIPVVIFAEDDGTPTPAQGVAADKTAECVVDLDVEAAPVISEGAKRRALRKAKAAQAIQAAQAGWEEDSASQKRDCDIPVVIFAEDDGTLTPAQGVAADKTAECVVDLDVEAAQVISEGAKRRALRKAKAAQAIQAAQAFDVCVLD